MISVLVANTKGGCGKTTVATNLAAAFADHGHKVVLADADRQQSARRWLAERPAHVAPILAEDWSKKTGKPPKGTDRLVIDSPASMRRGQIEELVALADLVVLPVMPSIFDQGASKEFVKKLGRMTAIKKGKKTVIVVGNRMRPNTRASKRLDHFLVNMDRMVLTRIRDSQLYPEAAAVGLSLFDLRDTRTKLFRADWDPLLRFIEEGTL